MRPRRVVVIGRGELGVAICNTLWMRCEELKIWSILSISGHSHLQERAPPAAGIEADFWALRAASMAGGCQRPSRPMADPMAPTVRWAPRAPVVISTDKKSHPPNRPRKLPQKERTLAFTDISDTAPAGDPAYLAASDRQPARLAHFCPKMGKCASLAPGTARTGRR